ncbi:FAD-binding PCMH-type domain-containing protein [Fusarium sp. LHS14.1]|nr:FAD-binding PCMH-type domain-containing protein [Fusarium sp. LHS14.1]
MWKKLVVSLLSPCLVAALTSSRTGLVPPRTTEEVSKVLKILLDIGSGAGSWHIAVRGGGHSHWAGSSNIANGVTIDLGLLNRTEYDEATNFASVGGGALWNSLYEAAAEHSVSLVDEILDAVVSFANHDESEAADSFTPTFIYNTAISSDIIIDASILNVEGLRNSTGFNRITSIPAVSEDLRSRNLVTIAESTVDGTSRSIWVTMTFKANPIVLRRVVERWNTFVTQITIRRGNVLGLDSALTDNSVLWVNIVNLEDFAMSQDSSVRFRYLNYAEPSQNPLGGYGVDNAQYIRDVVAKYDPKGLFQTRVPGGFKISRVD